MRNDWENVLHKFGEFVLILIMKFLACDKTVWLIATQRAHGQGDAKEKACYLSMVRIAGFADEHDVTATMLIRNFI